jgi:acetyl esterase
VARKIPTRPDDDPTEGTIPMTSPLTRLADSLQARLLATVVTRVIKAPTLPLTSREVAEPETVLVPTRHGEVRCYVTRGAPGAPLAVGPGLPPVHVNMHGGAFLIGAARQDDHLVRAIAGEVGATVVNIDYPTGLRTRYPRIHEECLDVLRWVQTSGDTMGWDGDRVSVGGGSAGANLALGVLTLARREGAPRPRAGVLLLPQVDQTIPPEQYASPAVAPGGRAHHPFVDARLVRIVLGHYFADATRRADPVASPVLLSDQELAALPPLLVLCAEQDSLRPQGERFVDRARANDVAVTYHCAPGVDHDFPVRPKGRGEAALRELAELVRVHLTEHLALPVGQDDRQEDVPGVR